MNQKQFHTMTHKANQMQANHMPHNDDPSIIDMHMSRRGMLRVGGITIGLAALLAACVEDPSDAKPARVGEAPAPAALPDGIVTDGTLFRTLTSLHYSIISSHEVSKQLGKLTSDQTTVVDAFIAAHRDAIKAIDASTVKAGSTVWTCDNPRFDRIVVTALRDRITGRPRQGAEEVDVQPTDNANRDATAMVYAMESVGAATHQSLVPVFSKPEYRAASMVQADACARRAAAFALVINPDNRVNPTLIDNANLGGATVVTVAATTTTAAQNIAQPSEAGAGTGGTEAVETVAAPQIYYAVPSQFGILSAFQLAIGAPSSGNQFTLNIETPSLNSYVYDYQTDCA
ncbi:MAG: hypothetical protein ABIR32_12820 [Ilumatobacteraceae bacterium]